MTSRSMSARYSLVHPPRCEIGLTTDSSPRTRSDLEGRTPTESRDLAVMTKCQANSDSDEEYAREFV